MKRFLVIIVISMLFIVAGYYLYFVKGYYFNFNNTSAVTTPFYIDNEVIYRTNDAEGKPFVVKGVEVDSAYGSKRGTDFSVDEKTWLRWFKMIQQMGANTIRVSTVLDDQFYNSFYEYNKNRKEPLYLLQGMRVATDDWRTNKAESNLPFYQELKKDGRNLVDIIHGRKLLLTNDHKGSGIYRHDVSPWVLGFLIGDYWDQDMVAYLNKTLNTKQTFSGDYVNVSKDATTFEVMMAKVVEDIVSYESRKYSSQHLVSVNSSFTMDPFQYQEHFALQLGKYNTFQMDHIEPTKNMKSGLFASYAYEDEKLPAPSMLEDKEKEPYTASSSYLELLRQAHRMPVVISSFSYPSESYLNQIGRQDTEIVNDLKRFAANGFNGAVIRSWQDVWDRRAPETSYAVDLQQINEWHDPLTRTQHFGLIGFKPYRDEVLMRVDGKNNDWRDVSADFQDKTTKIAMTRDHAYIYFWIENPLIKDEELLYLALDMNPRLGSKKPNLIDKTFDRDMDFLVEVKPEQGANVYVQDRYQSVRQNFLEQISGENPYVKYPKRDSNKFEIVKYLQKDKKILTKEEMEHSKKVYNYKFADTKPLSLSNGINTEDADVVVENGRLEIRLPYQLLNVYDPLKFTIHDDYYQHYGVEPLKIDTFYLSLESGETRPLQSVKIPVQQLKPSVRVKEYTKPSYYKVKAYWEGEG